jgi:hypothetical protein
MEIERQGFCSIPGMAQLKPEQLKNIAKTLNAQASNKTKEEIDSIVKRETGIIDNIIVPEK